jgi:hydrogenase nickel incorporation protein HypA/HybF
MHEFGIAETILEGAMSAARAHGASHIDAIRIRIGDLSGVVEEALQFAFESIASGTPAEGARLVIERAPVRCYCPRCDRAFDAAPLDYGCPTCGEISGDVRGGRELDLLAIEVS